MAVPAFRAVGAAQFTSNNVSTPTTLAPTKGAGTVNGDLLVLVALSRSITATVATPTGWTLLTGFPKRHGTASGGSVYVFTKLADGSANDAPSVVWTGLATGTTGDSASAVILSYSGAQVGLDGTPQLTTGATTTTTITLPAYTTATDQSLVIGISLKISDSATTFTIVPPYTDASTRARRPAQGTHSRSLMQSDTRRGSRSDRSYIGRQYA